MMKFQDEFFKFLSVRVDGRIEERKTTNDLDPQLVVTEAEVHMNDSIVYMEEAWLPTLASFEKAQEAIFEATEVGFRHAGEFLVACKKDKFKREYSKFLDRIAEAKRQEEGQPTIYYLDPGSIDLIKSKIEEHGIPKKPDSDTKE